MQTGNISLRGRLTAGVATGVVLGIVIGVLFAQYFERGISYDTNAFHAVFLTNNQVYFGKLSKLNTQYPILTDVHYIQAFEAQDLINSAKSVGQLQLVKLGSELHQPQNIMYLNRDQILFVGPLKPDSQIVKSILDFKNNRTP